MSENSCLCSKALGKVQEFSWLINRYFCFIQTILFTKFATSIKALHNSPRYIELKLFLLGFVLSNC